MRVQVALFDGFDELDAIAPYEVLSAAALTVEIATLEESDGVRGAHGLRIRPDGRLDAAHLPDLLIVPGGGWVTRASRGVRAEVERGALPGFAREAHASGRTLVASVCTGAMLLAAAGILSGRHATTHHGALRDLEAAGAILVHARVVDDGDIVTSGGVTSGLDLALWLLERCVGAEAALEAERRMEYERRGTVWRAADERPRTRGGRIEIA